MIAATSFNGKKVALFGLGGSGVITAQSLQAGGADLTAWDDNPAQVNVAKNLGISTGDLRNVDWSSIDTFVLAPGVPLTHPKPHWSVEKANANNIPIIGDVEIFSLERANVAPDAPLIAITGTNGKSTTTALIAHILETAGRDVQMGGNIGTAILSLDEPSGDKYYVVECSSYQIDLAPSLHPTAGILLNLTPDHLDRHGSMEHYASVKSRLVEKSDTAILGVDDVWCRDIIRKLCEAGRNPKQVSVQTEVESGLYLEGSHLIKPSNAHKDVLIELDGIETLRGQHNAQNAAAATLACMDVGLSTEQIQSGMQSFSGLQHRMQPIAKLDNVIFINDSKATNAEAAAPALQSYENIFWILGGLAKDEGIRPLAPLFNRINKAFLIGEAAPEFAAELGGRVDFEISELVDRAIRAATHAAVEFSKNTGQASAILFSPACASFDQFRNFEIRGDCFVENVARIPGIEMLIPYQMNEDA
ncbi:UDP-N-acetylmuramoyl-L-alanine--D-glutamate ligase [Lentilitoribacter sp. Alg239-R112]|uniref:UDP-N-acetylmuramoyl-L-alanine--D-glutamate ligase n=1 Tax=Lentilitoribacter sp. Alg239-R112 TaxID=2305987 RepID=UPI0013A6C0E2|nr:UDP-N-acetylmuramoyl-L-alanine--D-glutamate ligase [Lentilitoribacter sp. Alg239-R112]